MQIRPDRQTLLWSATWPKDVQAIAREFQHNAYQVRASPCKQLNSLLPALQCLNNFTHVSIRSKEEAFSNHPVAISFVPLGSHFDLNFGPYLSQVLIGSADLKANHRIKQQVEIVEEMDKYRKCIRLLEKEMDGGKILIFCETKRGCDAVGYCSFD